MICSNCSTQSPAGFAYCGNCGTRLSVAETAPAETRRQVAVLFADVVGFTALAEQLDPEELRTVIGNLLAALSVEVYAQGGRIDMYAGDSIMATFGAPVAHENDPVLACQAALGMLEKVTGAGGGKQKLKIRIGINWGEVVYGRVGSSDRFTVLGDAVNVASRLQSSAQPNTAFVSDAVMARTSHFYEFVPLGEITVKNREQPVSAYQLLGLSKAPEKERGIKGKTAVWVDREREIEFLRDWFGRLGKEGGLLLITGDGGVGKTRLWEEAYQRATECSHRRISTCCHSYNQSVPFSSLAELLRTWLGLPARSTVDLMESTTRERLQSLGFSPDGVEKELLILLLTGTAKGSIADMDASVRKELSGNTLKNIFNAESLHCSLLLELDDFHWADDEGSNLLLEILPYIHNCGSILISRQPLPSDSAPSNITTLHIEPLPHAEALKLVGLLLGDEIEGLNHRICDVAEGNPYYIEEIIKHLASTGMLVITDGAKPQMTKPLEQIPLPPTLVAFITQKIDSCSVPARSLLAALAVMESADEELLGEMGNITDVVGALAELGKHYLITRTRDGIYHPANDLIMDAMLKSMLASDKKRFHANAASFLIERQQHGEEHLAAIIHHLLAAGQNEDAVPWLMESGSRVLAQGALEAALGVFHQAKALLGTDSDFHLRMKVALRELQVLLDLFRTKEALAIIKKIPINECSATESAELAVLNLLAHIRSDDLNRALKLIPECLMQEKYLTPASRAVLHLYMAQCYARSQRLGDALREARLSLRRAQGLADIAVAAQANNVLGVLFNQQSRWNVALRYLFEALRLRRRIGKKDEIASTLANITTAYANLNKLTPLRKYARQALEIAHASDNKLAEGSSLVNLGNAALGECKWDEATGYFTNARDLFASLGAENPKLVAEMNLALIYMNSGHLYRAITILLRQKKAFIKSGDLIQLANVNQTLIRLYYMRGDYAEALAIADDYLNKKHAEDEDDRLESVQQMKIILELLLGRGNGFDDSEFNTARKWILGRKQPVYDDFVPLLLDRLLGVKVIDKALAERLAGAIKANKEKREKLQLQFLQGAMALADTDYRMAYDILSKTLAQFRKLDMNYFIVVSCLHLGMALRNAGNLRQAVKVLKSADHALGIVGNKQLAQALSRELAWAGGEQPTTNAGYQGQL